jgi:hypothetical protein
MIPTAVWGRGGIEILEVEPGLCDSLLVCTLDAKGLPDEPSRETLLSGLPSSIIVALSLLDAEGDERAHSLAEVRVEPDLWEQIFVVKMPMVERRVDSIEEVAALLERLGPIPLIAIQGFAGAGPWRIRSRLAVRPLASAEILRVETLLAGRREGDEPDRQEVSVGLAALLRLVFGGRANDEWVADAVSRPFLPESLEENPSGAPRSGD